MKTELLVQMDGCSPSATQCQLLLVGATNRPEVCCSSSGGNFDADADLV